jgi:hypothetical protein
MAPAVWKQKGQAMHLMDLLWFLKNLAQHHHGWEGGGRMVSDSRSIKRCVMVVSFVALHVRVFRAAGMENFRLNGTMALFLRLFSYLVSDSWILHKACFDTQQIANYSSSRRLEGKMRQLMCSWSRKEEHEVVWTCRVT